MSSKWHHNFPKIAREAGFTIRELSIGHCIDWRFVASIDPYNIVSERDYEKLDEFIPHISEVPIGTVLNNRILDPAIGKYFILAQFSIQYLLFCKQFLDETVVEIRSSIQELQSENGRLETINKKKNDEIMLLQRRLQRAESISHQHASQTTVFPCSKCTKNFISSELLSAHILRKHATNVRASDDSTDRKSSNTDTSLINTIKLELEVKQLKERLNAAEKDLNNQRCSKDHRCRSCTDEHSNNSVAQEAPRPKVQLHSIGIQSNLKNEKDLNEKEVQTQTDANASPSPSFPTEAPRVENLISKADLQSFLEEQKQLYEIWKTSERQSIDRQIEAVKKNLVDAIQTIDKSERTTPIPAASDEGVWKERYHELENMYEASQKQARDTMVSFEMAYTQKIEQLENLLSTTREPEERKSPVVNVVTSHVKKSIHLNTVTLPEITIEGAKDRVADESLSTATVPKHADHLQTDSSGSDSIESDEELRLLEAAKASRLNAHPLNRVDAIAKDHGNPLKAPQPAVVSATVLSLLVSPKKQIMNQFRARLKAIGVDPKSKQLSGDGLNAACEALVQRRDAQKKKHKNFFITRNQLIAKVDQMARLKLGENPSVPPSDKLNVKKRENVVPKMHKPSSPPPLATRMTRYSPVLELLPSKQQLQVPPDKAANQPTDMNVFKSKSAITTSPASGRPVIKLSGDDVITVHAEITPVVAAEVSPHSPIPLKRGSISSHDQHVERLLDTPIKTLSTIALSTSKKLHASEADLEGNNSDISEILETVPFHPKPMPKKRVLFNLDRADVIADAGASSNKPQPITQKGKRTEQLVSSQNAKVDEDSDWNISSFDEEK
ncbi:cilium assembly protein DZIP1L [Anopheles aquasalis]|uniref:cilium assembly protein DZIP1L n=1 Tax=Anopheles aquasalis TaxID=42839 RepID=UPI00215B3F20|nr:cilium assembly protein DZIP1L [Anopheles aquasalis]